MKREMKEAKMASYKNALGESGFAIITEHGGMKVPVMESIRTEMAGMGCEVWVLKNTLARKAFHELGSADAVPFFVGPSVMFCGNGEEIAPIAKALQKYVRKHTSLKVKGIVFDGRAYPREDFAAFLSMPTKNEVRSKLLSVMKAPASQFVGVLNAPRRLVTVLKGYAEKRAG